MSKSLVILGRQPALGLAELESLLGPNAITPLSTPGTALVDFSWENTVYGSGGIPVDTFVTDPETIYRRLGGTVKVAKFLHEFEHTNWGKIEKYLLENLPKHLKYAPEGKLNIGLSTYGLNISLGKMQASGLTIKKALKEHGKSVRLVPNKSASLNSAQVIHNKLISPYGWELIFVQDNHRVLMGLTVHEQDIEAYASRDQGRPFRDAKVGMLPPKLAQIIVNLAVGHPEPVHHTDQPLLDPFCGTGVILQEAGLMSYSIYGTDIDPRMVEYTIKNLEWLGEQRHEHWWKPDVEVGDATSFKWESRSFHSKPFAIATETYLGRPFSHQPDAETLQKVMQDVDTIHRKFLQNVARQTHTGFRMCIAVPAWFTKSGVKHLKTLDSLEELGYNRLSFVHAAEKDLIYHREGQIVGRELVVLQRK